MKRKKIESILKKIREWSEKNGDDQLGSLCDEVQATLDEEGSEDDDSGSNPPGQPPGNKPPGRP